MSQFIKVSMISLVAVGLAGASTWYVSPTGSDSNDGKTSAKPFASPSKGAAAAGAGDTILLAGGTYKMSATLKLTTSGTASSKIYLFAENAYNKRAVLDFTSQGFGSTNQGIVLNGSYWHVRGLDVYRAGDNGMQISGGSNNIVEWCSFHENMDAGFQIVHLGANNLVLNCDSYWNYDSASSGGNADGFSPKLTLGTGNVFRGCRSWGNSDDGWDGYLKQTEANQPDDITTTIENSWAFNNGYYHGDPSSSKNTSSMNGNGMKMGGSANKDQRHNHILRNCLAFGNKSKQFDQNNNPGSMTLINCTAFGSGKNFAIAMTLASGKTLTVENSVSAGGGSVDLLSNAVQKNNTWLTGFAVANSDFLSVDTAGVRGPRKSDGSLPDITFMHLKTTSALVDAGINVGLPYAGKAPDLGAFETGTTSGVVEREVISYRSNLRVVGGLSGHATILANLESTAQMTLSVADAMGHVVLVRDLGVWMPGQRSADMDLTGLGAGIYLATVRGETGLAQSTRVVVR